ncbi:MAG: YcaO-like family protein [Rhodopila sp.]|nr:YcaO-like family protein [Rhodopila sp.]
MNARSEMQPLAGLFAAAATILAGEAAAQGPAFDLLARLDYLDGEERAAPHRAALLRAASRFERVFTLRAEDAPGLIALGAEVDPARVGVREVPAGSVSGTGLTFRQAFESCVGEGAEYLSQCAVDDDPVTLLTADEALADVPPALHALWDRLRPYRRDQDAAKTGWITGADLRDGRPAYLPADLCLRRPAETRDIDLPWPLSTGCGAGPDPLDATLHGLLELIERDAVAMWWRGGIRARVVPPGVGGVLLARLRGETTKRRTWLLDVTSDISVPVVVAVSCNDDGFGLCRGFAARPTLPAAADAALMEMAQMELAYQITATKRAVRGEAALNDIDRQHIQRFTMVDVAATPALHPLAPPTPPCDLPTQDKIGVLAGVRRRLEAVGLTAYAVNLTRAALGIPVVRTFCPGLEMGMASPPGPRLRLAAARSGIDPCSAIPL